MSVLVALSLAAGAAPALAGGPPIGADLKALGTPRTLTVLGAGLAGSLAALAVESPTRQAAFFENQAFDGPSDMGNSYGSGLTLGALSALLLGAGHLAHDEGLKQTGSEMVRALAYTAILVTATKVAVGRTRPNGGAYSFPSGHTAAAFAVAPILAKRLGWSVAIPAYLVAGATGIGRMEDRKHYLSDVVFGAAVGLSIGMAVTGHDAREAGDDGSTLAAHGSRIEIGASPRGAAVTLRF